MVGCEKWVETVEIDSFGDRTRARRNSFETRLNLRFAPCCSSGNWDGNTRGRFLRHRTCWRKPQDILTHPDIDTAADRKSRWTAFHRACKSKPAFRIHVTFGPSSFPPGATDDLGTYGIWQLPKRSGQQDNG